MIASLADRTTSVSVIIPTYNRIKPLERALDSVRSQTLTPTEVIVVDDNTDDSVSEIIKAIVRDLQRFLAVKYVRSCGVGGGEARNIGANHATSELLAFLDDDDVWYGTKLECQVRHIKTCEKGCVAVLTKQHRVTDDTTSQMEIRGELPAETAELLFTNLMPTTSTLLINRNIFLEIGGFDGKLKAGQDRDLWLRLLSDHEVCLIPEPLCSVDMRKNREDSITGGENRVIGTHQFYLKWKNHPALSDRKMYNRYWFSYHVRVANAMVRMKKKREAMSSYLRAFQHRISLRLTYVLLKVYFSHVWESLTRSNPRNNYK